MLFAVAKEIRIHLDNSCHFGFEESFLLRPNKSCIFNVLQRIFARLEKRSFAQVLGKSVRAGEKKINFC